MYSYPTAQYGTRAGIAQPVSQLWCARPDWCAWRWPVASWLLLQLWRGGAVKAGCVPLDPAGYRKAVP